MLQSLSSRERLENRLSDRKAPVLRDGTSLGSLIDFDKHEVSIRLLNDAEIHDLELRRVFARAWIIVGHCNEIPNAGDYVVRYIGEDQVIVSRGKDGKVRLFLNACTHRGMELCRAEEGHATLFRCPYHGWTFNGEGRLMGAPYEQEMYGEWDKSQYSLRRAHVAVRHDVIFGSFAESPVSLEDWLGEFGWYFDEIYKGDMEVVPANLPRMQVQSNWKSPAEQSCGDGYHAPSLHRCLLELGFSKPTDSKSWGMDSHDVSSLEGHGLRVAEYAHAVYHAAEEPEPFPVGWLVLGAMFPGVNVGGNAARGGRQNGLAPMDPQGEVVRSAFLGGITPRGPTAYSSWRLQLIERDAPEKAKAALQSKVAESTIGADDLTAWTSMQRTARGVVGRDLTLKYNALLGENRPDDWAGPALVHRGFSKDDNQWHFWLRWYEMMTHDENA